MRSDCIQAVSVALGRALKVGEAQKIEQRIREQKILLANKDRQKYLQMTEGQRLREAAKMAAEALKAEAAKKQQRIALTVLANQRLTQYLENQPGLMIDSVDRILAPKFDGLDNIQSAESKFKAIYNEYTRELSRHIEKFGPKLLGIMQNDEAMIPVFRELRGQDSGIPEAKAFAKALTDTFEAMRTRFNAAGGAIGKLDDWAHPQTHSNYRVWKAGADGWVNFILPLLDRGRYTKENGMRMSDAELTEFLEHAYRSIVYDGEYGKTPGQSAGSGMRANRGREHRQLHFKDADSYLRYHAKFAEKSLMATIVSHINQMSRDIALTETLGPNPDLMLKVLEQKAFDEAGKAGLADDKIKGAVRGVDRLYDEVAGHPAPVGSELGARIASGIRSWLNIRLGSAVLTSFADEATAVVTARALNMSGSQYLINELKALGSEDARRQARSLGLGLETMLYAINRFGHEDFVDHVPVKVANAVIRASGLSFLTEARRQGFGALMMNKIGELVARHGALGDLHPGDNSLLLSKGITDTDWAIWRQAELEDWQGQQLLTARSILDVHGFTPKEVQAAADKLMGIVLEETGVAIIEPGARERAATSRRLERGTVLGELGRSALQFKSFPIAMMMRHYRRLLGDTGKMSKAGYAAAIIAGTTVMGALAVQLNEIASGRDPLEMFKDGKPNTAFWVRSALKGGALGFYGDFLQSQTTQHGTSIIAGMLGPSVGFVEEMLNLTQGNLIQALNGEDTNAGAETLRAIKNQTPGTSIWYLKAAFDHLVFQNLQEMASPGYLRRMEQRAQREFKQKYYWRPGELTPDRAPNLERTVQ